MAEGDPAEQNLKLVRLHYASFAGGDLDGLVDGLDPEVAINVHDEHGKAAEQPIRGRAGARSFFEGINAAITNSTVEVERLRADGNRVLAQITLGGTLRETGITGSIPAVHLFTIHEGLITEIRTHRPDWRNYGAETPA
ncbi:MAG: SnoaL-like domain [Solirubrobacterales bacterium]|jgi:ketosteroid isomerase-like protein|nr:SnoaL-like domain [Solirubrobacterales bacterium]